ncbi:MAG: sensor histidine kinase [Armatimonadota bacterium]|nr:sensor histidine kinase [Armatimonadota bacterium]
MGALRRRLELIILAHLWALAPLALAWFLIPSWRGPHAPNARELSALAVVAFVYLIVRTWQTLRAWQPGYNLVWPYVDVLLITAALVAIRDPTDALALLYFLPLASAVASGSLTNLLGLTAVASAGMALVILHSGSLWTINIIYRVIAIMVVASMYGWVIRTVALYERAAERAEYQKELAREIHDGVQYLLAALGARLELARQLITEDPARAAQILSEEGETVRRAGDELRYLVRRLRAEAKHVDLATALRQQVAALADRWTFAVDADIPARLPRLAPQAEHAILRVIQESLTNAAKHSQARRVEVRLQVMDDCLRCAIHDDGVGFDQAVAAQADGEGGLWHLGDRVSLAGGTMEIDSAAGRGTTVTATFPIRGR